MKFSGFLLRCIRLCRERINMLRLAGVAFPASVVHTVGNWMEFG